MNDVLNHPDGTRVDDLVGHGHGHGHGHGGEAGFTMVMLVVIMAVMSIMMGVAVQTAAFQVQREREAELIFRGKQYVEAIRLYKAKYGRYPMQLKEIWEAKPRVIRKKWKDPITDSENWGIIFLGQEGNQLGAGRLPGSITGAGGSPIGTQPPFGDPQQDPSLGDDASKPGGEGDDQGAFGGTSANRKVGPIVGVHSTSCDEAIKVYEGHTTYCEWRFFFKEDQRSGQNQVSIHPTPNVPMGVPPIPVVPPGQHGKGEDPEGPPSGGPPGPIQTPNP